ncbi:MAG: heme-binding protein, partial [Planctomycetota bacterium]
GLWTGSSANGSRTADLVAVAAAEDASVDRVAAASHASADLDGTFFFQTAGTDFPTHRGAFSVVALVRTREGGTIWARTVDAERWVPNGTTFFIRNGRACYDIGWVGVLTSRRRVDDGRPHALVLTWDERSGRARIYIDGRLDVERVLRPKAPLREAVLRVGFTNDDFPNPSALVGTIERLGCVRERLTDEQVERISRRLLEGGPMVSEREARAWYAVWDFGGRDGREVTERVVSDLSGHGHDLQLRRRDRAGETDPLPVVVAGVRPSDVPGGRSANGSGASSVEPEAFSWSVRDGALCLTLRPGRTPLSFCLWFTAAEASGAARAIAREMAGTVLDDGGPPLRRRLDGGPPRWPQRLTLPVAIGRDVGPLAVDVITHPQQNPWFCRMRLSGLDFLPDGDRMVVCDWDGNVWLVSGLSGLPERELPAGASSPTVTWQRIASGLFQPLGIKVFRGRIYVTCRDALYCLHDRNGDGEIDYYENVNNDHQVTDHFHEFAMGLQIDAEGNFYYAKSARHALPALVPQHGTLLRVSADGTRTDILATGFRAANGVCLNDDGTFFVTDQEGHWTPKNRINWVRPDGRFYGNMLGYHDVKDPSDAAMEPPLCWITNAMDRSPAELLWVRSRKWGPLNGALLNLSYGYGRIFIVPHERVGERMQGGVSPLPLHEFPTGIMRGRFHPQQGQLYVCGMVAWGSARHQPGGLFRVRYTGRPIHVPLELHARRQTLTIRFSGPLDRRTAEDSRNYAVKVWSLKRSANYGSKHYDEHPLAVTAARLAGDGQTVSLTVPELAPTMGMEIRYDIRTADGQPLRERIHNTIHVVP